MLPNIRSTYTICEKQTHGHVHSAPAEDLKFEETKMTMKPFDTFQESNTPVESATTIAITIEYV